MATPEERFERLENQVRRLTQEVTRLRQQAAAAPAWIPVPDPTPASHPAASAVQSAPGAAEAHGVQAAGPDTSHAAHDWESRIGSRWLAVAGIIVSVLAAGFFLTLAIERGWISPVVQLLLIAAVGILLWALGAYLDLRSRLGHFAHVLAAGGVAITAFAAFAAHHITLYQEATGISLEVDSLLVAIIAVAALLDAGLRRAEAQAATAATLVPITALFAESWTAFSLAYPVVMAAAVLGAAMWRRWHVVPLFVVPGFFLVLLFHIVDDLGPTPVLVSALVVLALITATGLRARKDAAEEAPAAVAQAFAWLATWAVLLWAIGQWDVPLEAGVTLAVGLAAGALALWTRVLKGVRIGWAVAALPALVLWVPMLEWDAPVPYLWAGMLVLVAWARTRWQAVWLNVLAAALGVLLVLRLVAVHAGHIEARESLFLVDVLAFIVVAAVLAAAWWLDARARHREPVIARVLLGLGSLTWLVLAAALWDGPVVSLAWAVVAAAGVGLGFAMDKMDLRVAGLATFALTLARIVIVDLAGVDPVWRVLAFAGVGVLLLLGSYLYVRRMRGPGRGAAAADAAATGPPKP